jgi:hypothetical protein
MASIPSQERMIDPFASYNSNVVNKITQMVSHDVEGLLTVGSLQVTIDSTSPTDTVVVSEGYAIKDDVLIHITSPHQVDFSKAENYVNPSTVLPQQGGYHYVVLDYAYAKSRPAPQASIKILKPTERNLLSLSTNYILLKVVELNIVSPHVIDALYDYDPDTPTNERQYLRYYAGGAVTRPTFDDERDQGRIIFETSNDKFFFGHLSEWRELTAGGVTIDINTIDTTGVTVGSLCYVDNNRVAQLAIATGVDTGADIVTLGIGLAVGGSGRASVSGFVEQVPVETGSIVSTGDLLYLSNTDPGTVTNVRTRPFYQVVGRALSSGNSTTRIDMIFDPKVVIGFGVEGQVTPSNVHALGYYEDIDVSQLDGSNAYICQWYDDSNNRQIVPTAVEVRDGGNTLRIIMSTNTITLNYVIMSGNSAGYSKVEASATDHSALYNLDFGSSGHTGFSANPHTDADHAVPAIPSGETILFYKDTAVIGYTLDTDVDDTVVYITKGSAAGGQVGGSDTTGSTWTFPAHEHVIDLVGNHDHDLTVTLENVDSTNINYFRQATSGQGFTIKRAPDNYDTTEPAGSHEHGGETEGIVGNVEWRPKGVNFTKQTRI